MSQDYREDLLPGTQAPPSADQLPDGDQIQKGEDEAAAIHDSLDMISLDDQERKQVGPVTSPEELDLDREYAELCDRFSFLLKLVDRPPDAMRQGYEMERALGIYREANGRLLQLSRGVLLICAGDLTEQNDDAEEGAHEAALDEQVPEERRELIANVTDALDRLRADQQEAVARRQLRRQRKEERLQAELQLSQKRQGQTRKLADMAAAPLPAPQETHKKK